MNSRLIPQLARWVLEIFSISVIYYIAARFGLLLAFENTNATPVWPPSGIAFTAVLLLGYRVWPGIFIGAFAANVLVFLSNHTASLPLILWVSTFIAIGNTLEAITGTILFHHLIGKDSNPFNRSQDTFKFLVVVMAMSLVSAIIGPTKLCLDGIVPWSAYETVWFTWLMGDMTGILVVTPFLLSWIRYPVFSWNSAKFFELALLFILLYLSSQMGFGVGEQTQGIYYPLAFLPIPFLIWSAFRFSLRVTTTAVLLVSGLVIWKTVIGAGPFVRESVNESLLLLQIFVGVITTTILAMSSVIAESRKAEEEVRQFNESLEHKVNQRTAQLQTTLKELASEMTERKRAEDDADRFFKISLDWLVISGFDQTIKRVNPSFMKATGFTESELLNIKSLDLVHPDDRPAAEEEIRKLASGGETILFECRILAKNGSYRWSQWSAVPVSAQGLIFAMGRDVTERKQAEAALLQKTIELVRINGEREQLKLFSMIVSHDLQSPLQKIISLTELMQLRNQAQLDDKGKDSLARLKNAAVHMSELIESMLRFSRVAANEEPFESLDLNQMMNALLSDLEMRIKETGAQIELKKLPVIRGDKMQIRELFLNLITNAIKFHKKEELPRVAIDSKNLGNGMVEITVSDNGIGFNIEDTERIFKPFERLHSQDEFEGHGMGLAICQRVVLHHGGKIVVRSAVGKGTAFIITLPSVLEDAEKAA